MNRKLIARLITVLFSLSLLGGVAMAQAAAPAKAPKASKTAKAAAPAADLVVALSVWVAAASSAASAFFFFLAHAGVAARLSARPSTAAHANNLIVNGFISEFLFIFILDAVSRGLPQAQAWATKSPCEQASRRGPTNKSASLFLRP